jgi:phenylacetate-CoA ligase
MSDHFDTLETRDPQARERDLMARLPAQIAHAQQHAPAFARILDGVDAAAVKSRESLARLPVIRKSELLEQQKAARPFGGFSAVGWGANLRRASRVYASPGPIYEPECARPDYWRLARALFAAGFRSGDLVHNSFSYHLTPGAWIAESGAFALGCTVFPGGVGNTEQQIEAMLDLQPDGYVGTPSFLKILIDKADSLGTPLRSLKKALVSGEAFLPAQRAALVDHGVSGYQAYATADVGSIAYESAAREGLIVDENLILEIVRPGTGDPVPAGEVGEVVVTTFNPDYPLVRFGTGDLSALLPGASPCGRTNTRIKGWMGRADQTAKVKGMFVHPSQVAEVMRRHREVTKARLVVTNPGSVDRMVLRCEVAGNPEGLVEALQGSLRDVTKVRGEVELSAPGALPNDGKVIEDARSYE